MSMLQYCIKLFLFTFIAVAKLQGQDTLMINIQQADSLFFNNSYYLLAAEMNVDAHKALVLQSKMYPNPTISAELNMVDPQNKRLFHLGKSGQMAFQVEQLILLGGKRKAQIDMAKTNTEIAEIEFQKLVHNLKFHLHSQLFALGQQDFLIKKYNQQLSLLDGLLLSYKTQVDKGNIPMSELVRLKGAYLKLNNDRAEILAQYYDTQAILQKILQSTVTISFVFTENDIKNYVKLITIDELKSTALSSRTDLIILDKNKQLAEQYLVLQKKMAIPDLSVYAAYDQNGGAFANQVNGGVSIALPIFDKNKGNINFADFKRREIEFENLAMRNEVFTEIANKYNYYNHTISEYQKAVGLYNQDFEITIKGMTDNFQKRNVSIIEFIDFFEAYNEVLTELTRIKTQLVTSAEQLNLLIGKELY